MKAEESLVFRYFISLSLLLPAACATDGAAPKHILSDEIERLGTYSHAVQAGDFVFVAGMIAHRKGEGLAAGEIDVQARTAYDNLASALEASGLALSDVVKVTVYLKSSGDMAITDRIFAEYFPDRPPARTTVPGADWGRDDILIEVDAIAYRRQ